MPAIDSVIIAKDKSFRVVSVNTLKETVMIKEGDRFLNIKTRDMELKDGKHRIKDELIEELFRIDEDLDK